MTEEAAGVHGSDSMWRWWPCFIGGFCGPLVAHALTAWMPPAVAVGLAFFSMWLLYTQALAADGGRPEPSWARG